LPATRAGDHSPNAKVPPVGMTDAALVRRVLEGDVGAYAALLDRHAPICLRYATRMLGNREDAEDAAQEAFVRAYAALGRYEGRTAFRTWLFAILINRCRTIALHRSRRERRVAVDEEAVASATIGDPTVATDLREEIQRAIGLLDPEHREAFLLKHVEELSYDEMSEATGVGVSALKMRVKRACARLRDLLGEDDNGG
jgi:RNA polymerase sigma-70 factor, ECF subfamily